MRRTDWLLIDHKMVFTIVKVLSILRIQTFKWKTLIICYGQKVSAGLSYRQKVYSYMAETFATCKPWYKSRLFMQCLCILVGCVNRNIKVITKPSCKVNPWKGWREQSSDFKQVILNLNPFYKSAAHYKLEGRTHKA